MDRVHINFWIVFDIAMLAISIINVCPKGLFLSFFFINQFLVCNEKNHLSMEIQRIIINLLQLAAADGTPLFTTNNVASITEVSV